MPYNAHVVVCTSAVEGHGIDRNLAYRMAGYTLEYEKTAVKTLLKRGLTPPILSKSLDSFDRCWQSEIGTTELIPFVRTEGFLIVDLISSGVRFHSDVLEDGFDLGQILKVRWSSLLSIGTKVTKHRAHNSRRATWGGFCARRYRSMGDEIHNCRATVGGVVPVVHEVDEGRDLVRRESHDA